MTMINPYDQYRRIATETADPVELVLMLYRGAIRNLEVAEAALERRDSSQAHESLVKTQNIVAELMGTLNLDAGELAHNLHRLYDYMQRRLLLANLRKDAAPAAEVRGMLTDLLATWEELAQRYRAARAVQPALVGVRGAA
ncbi:flagellar export chaperone FliS [Sphaerobacter thermophilus]|jgi:flagellar protein FliS|nr:flagellar export chaperone FliS [Sphaerobacter thermophilus]